jgi:hypothetical protein
LLPRTLISPVAPRLTVPPEIVLATTACVSLLWVVVMPVIVTSRQCEVKKRRKSQQVDAESITRRGSSSDQTLLRHISGGWP